MIAISTYFRWEVNMGLISAGTLVIILLGTIAVKDKHALRAKEKEICKAKLEVVMTRSSLARKMVKPDDPCVALRIFADYDKP